MVKNRRKSPEGSRVLVVGELNLDLILNDLEQFPETGKEVLAREMTLTLGSSAAIFAGNLAVLGRPVSFAGKIGKDFFADRILSDLASRGVDTRHILFSEMAGTGMTVAFNVHEERSMVTYPGAMNLFSIGDITDEALESSGHLHVSSVFLQPGLKPGLEKLFLRARDAGLTTSLDPQWDPAEQWDLDWKTVLPLVDVFLPNREELRNISGEQELEAGIGALRDFANIIAVKCGQDGAVVWSDAGLLQQPAFLNTKIADAIGAGDSFDAGFIFRFLQKESLQRCAEFGALCGAINTTRNGGTTAFSDQKAIKDIALECFNYHIDDL